MNSGKTTAMTMKRINRELADLAKEDLGGMTLVPNEKNLFEWKATIPGPEGSVYEGGEFHVEIVLPSDYPFTAPKAVFKTRIYHMNISESGQVCVDLLKHNWSPALSLFKVLLSISSLLTDPNPKDPLVPAIATEYNRRRQQHDATARNWTELYARPRVPAPTPPSIPGPSRVQQGHVPNSRPGEVIVIDDSPSRPTRTQRPRALPRAEPSVTLDLTADDDMAVSPRPRKRKPESSGDQARQRRRTGEGSHSNHEVIVIDE